MLTLLINKILYIAFFISFIVIIRHGYLFSVNLMSDEPKKYRLPNRELIYVCISLAVLLASILKGIGL
jgi:preprotein translocase subunit Sec61beta